MILFPNAKINIGLRVLRRRTDGYHDLSTVMVPVGWHDILEMVPGKGDRTTLTIVGPDNLGLTDSSDNLVIKALRALERHIGHTLPPLDIYLSKLVPTGAGLGGGSADAAFTIRGANELFGLGLDKATMAAVAATAGADCPFFIYDRPMLAEGIGEILSEIDMPQLDKLTVLIVKPAAEAVSTREAYAGVRPSELPEGVSLVEALKEPVACWKGSDVIVNDFEASVFPLRPAIADVKRAMAAQGALYTAMSGSGAAVFGLFDCDKMAERAAKLFEGCDIFTGPLSSGVYAER